MKQPYEHPQFVFTESHLNSLLKKAESVYKKAGEKAYFKHAENTARILFQNRADPETIIAGLYHHIEPEKLVRADLGLPLKPLEINQTEVLKILEKLNLVNAASERQVDSLKLIRLITQAHDPRAFLVRIAEDFEKLKNFEDRKKILEKKYGKMDSIKRLRGKKTGLAVSREVGKEFDSLVKRVDAFVPIAHALNYYTLVTEMENEKFKRTNPAAFKEIQNFVKAGEHEAKLKKFNKILLDFLGYEQLAPGRLSPSGALATVEDFSSRTKSEHSIYKKMVMRGVPLEKVHDIKGIRIVLGGDENNPEGVFTLVNLLKEQGFVPAQEAYLPPGTRAEKNYIANPKENGYQAYHLIGYLPGVEPVPENIVELQILSKEMQDNNEYGAAHRLFREHADLLPGKKKELEDGLKLLSEAGKSEDPLYAIKKILGRDFVTVTVRKDGETHELKVPSHTTMRELGVLSEKSLDGLNVNEAIVFRKEGKKFLGPEAHVHHGDRVELKFKHQHFSKEKLFEISDALKTLEAKKILAKHLPRKIS